MKLKTLLAAALPIAFATAALAGDPAPAPAAKATTYSVTGKYYETCACQVSCPCASNAILPTGGDHCDAISLFHIDKGMVGVTKMDGLNLGVVLRSPKGVKVQDSLEKGEMDLFTLYLDDKANAQQKDAMNILLPALFGTKEIKGSKPPQWLPMMLEASDDTAKFTIDGGTKLSFDIENIKVGAKTKLDAAKAGNGNRIELTNSAPFPFVSHITQGIAKKFHYDDLGTKWDYEGRNAFFGQMMAKGTYAPEAAKKAEK